MLVGSRNAELQLVLGLGGGGEMWASVEAAGWREGSTQVKEGESEAKWGALQGKKDREAGGRGMCTGKRKSLWLEK